MRSKRLGRKIKGEVFAMHDHLPRPISQILVLEQLPRSFRLCLSDLRTIAAALPELLSVSMTQAHEAASPAHVGILRVALSILDDSECVTRPNPCTCEQAIQ